MKYLRAARVLVVALGCVIGASALFAQTGPRDGLWEGVDSEGEIIILEVRNLGTEVLVKDFLTIHMCLSGESKRFGHNNFDGFIPIVNRRFTHLRSMSDSPPRPSGEDFLAVAIQGRFNSAISATGTLSGALAAFVEGSFQAQTCPTEDVTWSADWVGPAPSHRDMGSPNFVVCLSCEDQVRRGYGLLRR